MRSGRVVYTALLVLATVAAITHFATRAEASCLAQNEDGKWRNADPNTRGLARIELRFTCQDQILNGELYPPGPAWHVHVWGRCHPTNCDWGEVGAERTSGGFVYGKYNQGYAKRYVYARMSQLYPGQLWVWTYTNFTDPARSDYARSDWFTREP